MRQLRRGVGVQQRWAPLEVHESHCGESRRPSDCRGAPRQHLDGEVVVTPARAPVDVGFAEDGGQPAHQPDYVAGQGEPQSLGGGDEQRTQRRGGKVGSDHGRCRGHTVQVTGRDRQHDVSDHLPDTQVADECDRATAARAGCGGTDHATGNDQYRNGRSAGQLSSCGAVRTDRDRRRTCADQGAAPDGRRAADVGACGWHRQIVPWHP